MLWVFLFSGEGQSKTWDFLKMLRVSSTLATAAVLTLVSRAQAGTSVDHCRSYGVLNQVASQEYEEVIRAADQPLSTESERLSATLLASWGAGRAAVKLDEAMAMYHLDKHAAGAAAASIKKCADAGDAGAALLYGMAVHAKLTSDHDPASARSYYERAVAGGDPIASLGVAVLSFEAGDRASFENEIDAAKNRNSNLTDYSIGIMFFRGVVFPRSNQEAARWILSSAESGNPDAQGLIALMYQQGIGVPKDAEKSQQWLKAQIENSKKSTATDRAEEIVEDVFKSNKAKF